MGKLLLMPVVIVLVMSMFFTSCKKEEENQPTTGIVEGIITDFETSLAIADVRIIVFDANTNSPIGDTYSTNANGEYSIELYPGTYYLKLNCLGYESIPHPGVTALPIAVVINESVVADFQMSASNIIDGGVISGTVTALDASVAGGLIIAEKGDLAYSSVSDADGNYFIYNVPAGDYSVKCWKAGYNSNIQEINIEASMEKSDVNITLTQDATANVTGTISFLATENKEVDVSLVHPVTKETVPGLNIKTEGGNYIFENVPNGTYIGRASFENDSLVLDPDWVVKNGGEPTIEVNNADVSLNYSVTGAVSLQNPTNNSLSTQPVEVSLDTLSFSWIPYPSTSDYVIEVIDGNGNIIWGGFSADWSQKNIVIPGSQTSIEYDADGTANAQLEAGKTYRWRIFSSKDDNQSVTGWRLISVSEDQMGLIKIAE